ncbi:MAG: Cyclic pyranopterin monophosphate synthase [Deltaproteobacteria bacterium ADurb.Bin058]|nr:MAG: Cyclic pyranopterin monophosphate synthase [Deltaproteobacteria bacterium ADurb.Bin058]
MIRFAIDLKPHTISFVEARNEKNGEMPMPGESLVGNRLHICVAEDCNNNCIFCMEEDRDARRDRMAGQTDDDVRRMIASVDSSVKEIMFTSGEPTLHPSLPKYIQWSSEAGFETVGLITNGRRLSYRPYARLLLENGLNHILISIHGPDARTHDALTRTKGAFIQAMAGLANLTVLKREFPALKIHTSYVVTARNYNKVIEFVEVMRHFSIDQHVFNVMMPDGRGQTLFDQLMPRYSDVAAQFAKMADMLPPRDLERIFVLDIPYCTTTMLPDRVRGYVERYFHYEPEGTVRIAELTEQANRGDRELLIEERALTGEEREYSKVAKTARDDSIRIKRPECYTCGYEQQCHGVFRSYIDKFGWDEFQPVQKELK